MRESKKNIWLVGGGTGGHISPAIAIAEEFVSQGHEAVLISIEKNRDYPSLIEANKKIPVVYYKASKIPKWPIEWLHFKKNIFYSFKMLNDLNSHKKPDAVVGFGGYPVFPCLLWAVVHGIPIYQHEQNSVHGLITKLFLIFSRRIFLSFPSSRINKKYFLTGNPLRADFLKITPPKSQSKTKDINKILIMGGSQGAKDLNNLYRDLIQDPFFKNIKVEISTGKEEYGQVKTIARKSDNVRPFINDVPKAMQDADLIMSRSGSSSLFEVLWAGKPAILFPFPHATSDHQKSNAMAVVDEIFYNCIDIRPFNSIAALEYVKLFIENKNKIKTSKFMKPALPLEAHKIITDIIMTDLNKNT